MEKRARPTLRAFNLSLFPVFSDVTQVNIADDVCLFSFALRKNKTPPTFPFLFVTS